MLRDRIQTPDVRGDVGRAASCTFYETQAYKFSGERWQYAVLPPASVTDLTFVQGDLSGLVAVVGKNLLLT